MNSYKLKELITIHNGTAYAHLNSGNIPLYGSGGLMGYVNESLHEGEAVLLPRKGTLDNIMHVEGKFWTVDTMYYATTNENLVLPYYLYSYLSLLDLSPLDSGSTLPSMTKSAYGDIKVNLPPIDTQRQIERVLRSIDKKIELNNRINAELEAMAKTLYDYWFVQFDFPDANGKPYKTSGGKMVYNETLKREIPEGWEVASLIDIASFKNGIACQRYFPKEGEEGVLKVIKIREFSSGLDESSDVVTADVPEDLIIQDGDILFSWSATLDVKIWAGGTGALNQHIFKVDSSDYPKSFYYFKVLGYLEHFKMVAELRKTTMGHITREHLEQSRVPLPPKSLIAKLDLLLKPILEKIVAKNKESQQLSELRDWLLPMLMNGQVNVI